MMSFDSAPVPRPADPGPGRSPRGDVHEGLRITAAYAWRLIVIAIAVYLVFAVLAKLTLVAVAVFVGLVISALLRPLVDLLARRMPRGLGVAAALLLGGTVPLSVIFAIMSTEVRPAERNVAGRPSPERAGKLAAAA